MQRVLRILPTWSGLLAILALAFLGSPAANDWIVPHGRFWSYLLALLVLAAAVAVPVVRWLFPTPRPGSDEARGLPRGVAMVATGLSSAVSVVAFSMMLLWPLLLMLWARTGGGGTQTLDAVWLAFRAAVGALLVLLPALCLLGWNRALRGMLRCGWGLCGLSLGPACFGPLWLSALWI